MILKLSKYTKGIALYLAINMLFQIFAPGVSMALTSGPSQPEVQSFEPVTTNQMVDPFTGDFTYNIPLFNLPGPDGGYPFNLAYHSGIGMDQEASWVGLGWSLNPGVINRNVKNLPDDFDGSEQITVTEYLKTNWTVGARGNANFELFGFDSKIGAALNISPSISMYYNSYKGVGYSMGFGTSLNKGLGTKATAGVGLNLSLDSQEGVGASPELTISSKSGAKGNSVKTSISAGYNSRLGLTQTSLGFSMSKSVESCSKTNSDEDRNINYGAGGKAAIPMSNNSYSPAVSTAFVGSSLNIAYNLGVDGAGAYGGFGVSGFYNKQELNSNLMSYPAVGYLNLEKYDGLHDSRALSDMGREKDGMVHKTSEMLAIPSFTYDNYLVVGQGIGNSYRPFRSDLGIGTNQYMRSNTAGGNIGVEFGAPAPPLPTVHTGMQMGYNWGKTESGKWKSNLDNLSSQIGFAPVEENKAYEPYYFKTFGEHTIDHYDSDRKELLKSEEAVYFEIDKNGENKEKRFKLQNVLNDEQNSAVITAADNKRKQRRARGVNLIPITNEELLENNDEILSEYDLKYYDTPQLEAYNTSDLADYNSRSTRSQGQIAGYTALNNSGQRYVYALPAYNNKKKEVRFSLDPENSITNSTQKLVNIDHNNQEIKYDFKGTNEHFYAMETPAYAHSYLLTSILGADYVDIDNNGPSDNDLGYWVKFNYVKTSDDYKWRAPFSKANYIQGYKTSTIDDEGAYVYGEKENWYLATAETKTHIAEFLVESRYDARGVLNEVQNYDLTDASSYRLKKIRIFTKAERYTNGVLNPNAVPIKEVHLDHAYELCQDLPNNSLSSGDGKLTLKKLWFTYKNNTRGALNKYEFDYEDGNQTTTDNPNYDEKAVDKWGNYQPYGANQDNIDNPYVNQFEYTKEEHDEHAAVWNLKGITLPSGGKIKIDYESDSYAYVQDEVAMQMTPITSLNDDIGTNDNVIDCDNCGPSNRKVFFELEHPVVTSSAFTTNEETNYIEKNYIRKGEDVYFKIKSTLTNTTAGLQEYVGGYAKVLDCGLGTYDNNNGEYTKGWIVLDYLTIGKRNGGSDIIYYHPFQVAAWQHIRTNQPDLLYKIGNSSEVQKKELSKMEAAAFSRSMLSAWADVGRIFRGVFGWMHNKGWGEEIQLGKSFLRLRTPDKEKFGGGCRVKQISITDNWDGSTTNESAEMYGQRYLYTTTDEDGNEMSSGVAAYEPVIGGDEIALRKPVRFALHTRLKTDNAMYSELPVNENLYPAPHVGYSKVTVMSINTHQQTELKKDGQTPLNTSTTGKVVNEYYTAKDFPVKTDYTKLLYHNTRGTKRKQNLTIPVPGIGTTSINKLSATQGYSIVLNDMHGKLRKVSNYGQDNNLDFIEDKPVSSVEYIYKTNSKGELDNRVDVILSDDPSDAEADTDGTYEMGVDVDFITDARRTISTSANAGVSFNNEQIAFLPALCPWPSYNYTENQLKTVVTNKVIHKSGILVKTKATDGQSIVMTENVKFDPLTGEPLLTKTTNNFDESIYNYSMPARWGYDAMGAAYQNIGKTFKATLTDSDGDGVYLASPENSFSFEGLTQGDVLIGEKTDNTNKVQFTYTYNYIGEFYFHPLTTIAEGDYKFKVVRSGYRNHLGAKGANYVTLNTDPTVGRTTLDCANSIEYVFSGLSSEGGNATRKTMSQGVVPRYIDNVLSATAVSFKDQWIKDFRDYRENNQANYTASNNKNPFATGEKGIWSTHKTYTYVDDRKQSTTNNEVDVKLAEDGTFDDVTMFNWGFSHLGSCFENWKMGNEITKVSPYALKLENKDVLGRYSAALYGYGGRQSTAVAANAKYNEIGFEGFEEYKENQNINQFNSTTSNLAFYNAYDATGGLNNDGLFNLTEQHDVLMGYGDEAILDIDYNDFVNLNLSTTDEVTVSALADKVFHLPIANSIAPQQVIAPSTIVDYNEVTDPLSSYYGKVVVKFGNWVFEDASTFWTGKVGIDKTVSVPQADFNTMTPVFITVSGEKAHSGNNSLKVTSTHATNTPVKFYQPYLNLIGGKKYEFSTWVAKTDDYYTSLANTNIGVTIEFLDNTGAVISSESVSSTPANFKGNVIEGWQKLDMSFEYPNNAVNLQFKFYPGEEGEHSTALNDLAFFDDIRIFPSTGLMKTHVYDPVDLKLKATLDDNNYATFYYYDESGALFLVKQETEKGIKTIQESRASMQH
ncbi:MAG: hypothetical protein N4A35_01150 [Flavobacteriales bacterium]|jgi:hypothetical protein|nr:hypothetical protein [Flavobacteriales bacterium]